MDCLPTRRLLSHEANVGTVRYDVSRTVFVGPEPKERRGGPMPCRPRTIRPGRDAENVPGSNGPQI